MEVRNIPVATGQVSGLILQGSGRLLWHSFKETTAAAGADYTLYDGPPASGQILLPVNLASNESTRDYFGPHGIPFFAGVYFDLLSGSVQGNVVVELSDPANPEHLPIVVTVPLAEIMAAQVVGA